MTLQLKTRQPVEDDVENWDDDDFMIDNEDLTFRSTSTATATSHHPHRRDSHTSFRSERDSLFGDEDRQVHLAGEDEQSTSDAISAAQHAGIPIPQNVPPSALVGGTIKRLGGRKIKKVVQEDWDDDIEMPQIGQALRIKPQDASQFPETLRQVSGTMSSSPVKLMQPAVIYRSPKKEDHPRTSAASTLDRFRDNDDDDDVFGDGDATIKAPKVLPRHKPISLITPPTPKKKEEDDDFEMDLELPSNGKLKLSSRRDIPRTPNIHSADDFDWGEGSLGTRFGGTRRDGFSNRSSNASALSPSIASSMTAESEDDAFDGLVLPIGPLDLKERLNQRKKSRSPNRPSSSDKRPRSSKQHLPETPIPEKENSLDDLDFENADVFSSGKLTLHRNIKVKDTRQNSPARPKVAVALTFTNKPVAPQPSRLPRPAGPHHERSHTQSSLEPVSESGGPIPSRPARRSQSRFGHSTTSSISSNHGPTTPLSTTFQPATPRRRELGQKASLGALRSEPVTSNSQLLRFKRSMPVMKPVEPPVRPESSRYDRPSSRTESHRTQFQTSFRPKTPVDRSQPAPSYQGSAAQARKPFLPAGSSSAQSHHVAAKSSRHFRRHDSDVGPETRPLSRAFSRSTMRSPSPRKHRPVEKIAAEPWQQLSKPKRNKQFGDGTELDGFDDLPTSAHTEIKFTKLPVAGSQRNTIRNKIYQNVLPGRGTPSPVSPYSPAKVDYQPHFARDTAASRKAREVSLAQRAPSTPGPLAPLPSQRVAQLSTRTIPNPHTPHGSVRSKKSRKPPQLKPHLITNMNSAKETKVVNGMTYNPDTCRWEGNENVLQAFDMSVSTPTATTLPSHMSRDKENMTPRPYLITNMGASTGVKRGGNMVFDPTHMRWLEMSSAGDDPLEGFNALEDDDPFKDIPDLEEKESEAGEGGRGRMSDVGGSEWLVGEEFDVGPEFIRRQKEEEERWRKKCERWINTTGRDGDAWRWALRDIVQGP